MPTFFLLLVLGHLHGLLECLVVEQYEHLVMPEFIESLHKLFAKASGLVKADGTCIVLVVEPVKLTLIANR